MRRSLSALAALLLGVSMLGIGSAKAAMFTYDFVIEFSGGNEPAGPTPWLTATFDDTDTDEVTLTLDSDGLVGDEFVTQWYFNADPLPGDLTITHQSGEVPTSTSSGLDAFKADGDGFFDILIEYATDAADRFGADLMSVLLLQGSGLDVSDIENVLSLGAGNSPDGLLAAAKVQGIGDNAQGSGWVAPIPIMGALPLLLSALGLLGFAGGWWRRWRSE